MITYKDAVAVAKMQAAGQIVANTLRLLGENIRPGIRTESLHEMAEAYIRSCHAIPSFLNYHGYPKSVCVSVNEEVVHGIPGKRLLCDGDIVSCDVGAIFEGYHGDAARTFMVGNVPEATQKLVRVTKECFFKALEQCRVGKRISDISRAVQSHAEGNGYGVVRELVGHGIGTAMHEDPEVPNFVQRRGGDPRLCAGMTLAIEPMINLGRAEVDFSQSDGWTVTTRDKRPSAHYENTVLITESAPLIFTLWEGEET